MYLFSSSHSLADVSALVWCTKTTFFLSAQNLALLASFQAKLEQSPEEDEEDDDKEKMQKEDEEGDDTGW